MITDPLGLPRHVAGNVKYFFTAPNQRMFVGWLLIFVVVVAAPAVWRHRRDIRSALREAFPASIYWHPSARLDYRYVAIDKVVEFALIGFIFLKSHKMAVWVSDWIAPLDLGGDALPAASAPIWAVLIFGTLSVIAYDLGYTYAHILAHRTPALWQFHKVHHSAEVMTPVTNFREHPLDRAWHLLLGSSCATVVDVGFRVLYGDAASYLFVFGVNIVLVGYVMLASFRHSHVWIDFGPRVSRWISSPAQHQIHHSTNPKHFDKNFCVYLSMWDRFFGTNYIPTPEDREVGVSFGVDEDVSGYKSVTGLWFTPFREVRKLLTSNEEPVSVAADADRP